MVQQNNRVVLILGSGHCGSTLLDMILSNNKCVVGLGELIQLPERKEIIKDKSFWNQDLLTKLSPFFNDGLIINRFIDKLHPSYRNNHYKIYQNIIETTDVPILIDSSKKLYWVKRSIDQLSNSDISPILIYLKRSPYAVINSYWRKRKMEFNALVNWHKQDVMSMDMYFKKARVPKIEISYDEFTYSPNETIKELCNFIGIDYTDSMLKFWTKEPSQIGGNSGTKSFYEKYKTGKVEIHERRKAFYADHSMEIKPDERWRTELNRDHIEKINSIFQIS